MNIAKALTAVILIVISLIIAYVAVRILEPVLPIIAFFILTYFIIRRLIAIATIIKEPRSLILIGIFGIAIAAVIVYIFSNLIKLIAFLLISWYTFKLLVRYYARDIEADLRVVLED